MERKDLIVFGLLGATAVGMFSQQESPHHSLPHVPETCYVEPFPLQSSMTVIATSGNFDSYYRG